MRSLALRRLAAPSMLVVLAACFALVSASAALATTYYVDSAGGNDSWSGTSPSTAWQNLTKVNTVTFSPGDQIRDLMDDFADDPAAGQVVLQDRLAQWFGRHFATADARLHHHLGEHR